MLCCLFSSSIYCIGRSRHIPYSKRLGRKASKGITLSCNLNDLIEINKSVEDMVDKLISLETILKEKLELIRPILDKCDKPHHKPECES